MSDALIGPQGGYSIIIGYIVDECYNLDDMMGHLASYFDYEAFARDLFIDDYYFTDGYVFRRY